MSKPKSQEAAEATGISDFYLVHADTWMAARSDEATLYERPWMKRFDALLERGSAVLDIGCGSGEPLAIYLAKAGFAVTGIDANQRMVEVFQDKLPDQVALVADMRTLCLKQRFNGLLAWDSFFHLSRDDQREMFQIFEKHALPGAALMFTTGTSDSEEVGTLFGARLYHASLAPDEYRTLLGLHGFQTVANVLNDPECRGRSVWLAKKSN